MKALVYHGPGSKRWEEVPEPSIHRPTDVIVKMTATTICGTDLHILKGDVPQVEAGRILGHEGVGVVTEIGSAVSRLSVGDRVVVSCISACGVCSNCREGLPSHCLDAEGRSGIGWILGHLIDGTQAEYVRVPFGDNSLTKLPEEVTDAEGIVLSDILPTGFEIGVEYGRIRPGDVVAIIGAGPVGLAAVATAHLHGPSQVIAIDVDHARLRRALTFGATSTVDSGRPGWETDVMKLTDGAGVDVAIEAVGIPETFSAAVDLVRPGGHVANVGVHGKSVTLPLDRLWIQNVTITTGLVNATTTSLLLKLLTAHRLPADAFVTHEFTFDHIEAAYEAFGDAAAHDALKVLIH